MAAPARRVATALLAGAVAFAVVLAAASTLGVTSTAVQAGSGSVTSCDTDGVTTTYTTGFDATAGYTVSSVAISGIAAGCNGKSINVVLADGSNASLGTGTAVTISATSATVTISGTVATSAVANVHVVIY